jgi:hypothetical protein
MCASCTDVGKGEAHWLRRTVNKAASSQPLVEENCLSLIGLAGKAALLSPALSDHTLSIRKPKLRSCVLTGSFER